MGSHVSRRPGPWGLQLPSPAGAREERPRAAAMDSCFSSEPSRCSSSGFRKWRRGCPGGWGGGSVGLITGSAEANASPSAEPQRWLPWSPWGAGAQLGRKQGCGRGPGLSWVWDAGGRASALGQAPPTRLDPPRGHPEWAPAPTRRGSTLICPGPGGGGPSLGLPTLCPSPSASQPRPGKLILRPDGLPLFVFKYNFY